MKTFIAVVAVAVIVLISVTTILRKKLYSKLIGYVQDGDFKAFEAETNKFFVKLLVNRSDLVYLRLKAAFIEGNSKKVRDTLAELEPLLFSEKQKGRVYMDAFNFYIGIEDKTNSLAYLNKINELDNDQMKKEANITYNIYIKKSDENLQDLLDEISDMKEENRAIDEYLISLIYKNKNDKANAKKYEELSKKHMAMLDAKIEKQHESK